MSKVLLETFLKLLPRGNKFDLQTIVHSTALISHVELVASFSLSGLQSVPSQYDVAAVNILRFLEKLFCHK